MRRRPKFALRTLMIVVTLLCVYFGYVAYKLHRDGVYAAGGDFGLSSSDPHSYAAEIRERVGDLPNHKSGEPFPLSVIPARAQHASHGKNHESWFYKVKLADGSETRVGFWVYEWDYSGPRSAATLIIYGRDTWQEVRSGAAEKRREERRALEREYRRIIMELEQETQEKAYRAKHPLPP